MVHMRFIIGFFFFGFLFYLIYIFFPEAFQTLVSWAAGVYEFLRAAIQSIMERANFKKPEETHQAMVFFQMFI